MDELKALRGDLASLRELVPGKSPSFRHPKRDPTRIKSNPQGPGLAS